MRCHFCGRTDALIRGIELPVARFTLRAHVDCKGHSEYRAVSHKEVEESNKAFTRYLDHAPEMLELITDLSQAYDDSQSGHELASRLYDLRCVALRLLAKIEGGEE